MAGSEQRWYCGTHSSPRALQWTPNGQSQKEQIRVHILLRLVAPMTEQLLKPHPIEDDHQN
jgi:hypothetical protein